VSKYSTGMESLERDDDVVASLAVTLDGFIARPDGSVDYLEKYPIAEFDFDAWVGSCQPWFAGLFRFLC
jgi:hypothetical protein